MYFIVRIILPIKMRTLNKVDGNFNQSHGLTAVDLWLY